MNDNSFAKYVKMDPLGLKSIQMLRGLPLLNNDKFQFPLSGYHNS